MSMDHTGHADLAGTHGWLGGGNPATGTATTSAKLERLICRERQVETEKFSLSEFWVQCVQWKYKEIPDENVSSVYTNKS